jgi:hypothetical protein
MTNPPYARVYGSFVTFTVPEPAGLPIAALGLAILTRRTSRRQKGEKA